MVGVGERIGNYRIERVLEGDPALEIYIGQHLVLPRTAKLKLLRSEVSTVRAVEHLREACLLDALHHLGIARVYESGVHGGRAWFALEHLEAPTLRDHMSPGAIDRVDAIALLRDLCEVIAHAYGRGVVHCGLRPERVLLTGRTRGFPLCIADWSDARLHDARLQQHVPTREAWHYTSPELVIGDPIDDRTDVFAIGVIAYQLLAGRLPFDQSILAIVDDGTTQHVPTAFHCPDMPPELTSLVDSMLAYDRWDRPSAVEVLGELAWIRDALTTRIESGVPGQLRRPAAAGQLRLRRPRWTPAHHLAGPVGELDERPSERVRLPADDES